jgi:hypothetical protein
LVHLATLPRSKVGKDLLSGSHNHTSFANSIVIHDSADAIREKVIEPESAVSTLVKILGATLRAQTFMAQKTTKFGKKLLIKADQNANAQWCIRLKKF